MKPREIIAAYPRNITYNQPRKLAAAHNRVESTQTKSNAQAPSSGLHAGVEVMVEVMGRCDGGRSVGLRGEVHEADRPSRIYLCLCLEGGGVSLCVRVPVCVVMRL